MKKKLSFIIVLFVVLGTVPYGAAHAAQRKNSEDTIVRQAAPAVIMIRGYQETSRKSSQRKRRTQKVSVGSGFFVNADGYVLTNRHVVAEEKSRYVIHTGTAILDAEVVYRDDREDLALLKVIGSSHPALVLGNSSRLQVGDKIIGIGNARGKKIDSVTRGVIEELDRDLIIRDDGETFRLLGLMQTTAKLYPGDSGGPVLDTNGQVIGVNAAIGQRARTRVGYAIPINTALEILDRLDIDLR